MSTCIVGCKLPHGLNIDLDVGGRKVPFTLKGRNASRIIGGYGLTTGVPKDAFVAWLESHKEFPYVRNQYLFVHNDMAGARAHARDNEKLRTGMEPIDPLDVKRVGHALSPEDVKKLAQQRAENPDRNRQIIE